MQAIIGLIGAAGSGKDTVASILHTRAGFHVTAFARALRQEVAEAFQISPDLLLDRQHKETALPQLALSQCRDLAFVDSMAALEVMNQHFDSDYWRQDLLDQPRSPRWTMQHWGTEYRRHLHGSDYWLTRLSTELQHYAGRPVVIADVRFPDEAEWITAQGGELWRIERDSPAVSPHCSELLLAGYPTHSTLNNHHTLDHLALTTLAALRDSHRRRRMTLAA